jgi:hypothetical protein
MLFPLEASGSLLRSVFGEVGHPCDVNFLFGWPLMLDCQLPGQAGASLSASMPAL